MNRPPFWLTIALGFCSLLTSAAPPEQFALWGDTAKADRYLAQPDPLNSEEVDVWKKRGLVAEDAGPNLPFFARPTFTVIARDTKVAREEIISRLEIADCSGECAVITFAAMGVEPQTVLQVKMSELTNAAGDKIPAENSDVRQVRYVKVGDGAKAQTVPSLLEEHTGISVPGFTAQQFWITCQIPKDAKPGDYKGIITIAVGGPETQPGAGWQRQLKLTIHVYPFTLPPPPINFYIYGNHSTDLKQLDQTLAGWKDQRLHGMTSATLIPPVTAKGDLPEKSMAAFLDAYAKAGFKHDVHIGLWNRVTAEWLNTPDKSIQMYGPWFRFYPFSKELDDRYVSHVKMIDRLCTERGLSLVLAVADEAGSHPWTTEATQHYNDLVKQQCPSVTRELTVGGGWAMKRAEDELWRDRINVWTTNRWLADKLELVKKNDPTAKIQAYNMGGGGSSAGGIESVRMLYGFFAWKAGVSGVSQWTYYHNSTPQDNYTWPADQPGRANVPTIRWEAVREGTKDYRYIALLEQRINSCTDPAAKEAAQLLDQIRERIELRTDKYDPIGGGKVPVPPPGTIDQWRRQIAEAILKLE